MKKLTLTRVETRHGFILGELHRNNLLSNTFLCYTLELPWKDNKRRVSCVPTGKYKCEPYSSRKYPKVTELQEVPGRDKILIHAGNFAKHTNGCILVGSHEDCMGVYDSRKTLAKVFREVGREFKLTIRERIR